MTTRTITDTTPGSHATALNQPLDLLSVAADRGLVSPEEASRCRAGRLQIPDEEAKAILHGLGFDESTIHELTLRSDAMPIPRQVGGFRILSLLGRGGCGAVFRAQQLSMGREVALKVLFPRRSAKTSHGSDLYREGLLTGAVNHPHVVTMLDVGKQGDLRFIAMELITEGDLASLLAQRGGHLPEREALELAIDCCKGLTGLGAVGLVHCDIKPRNVFLAAGGHAKLGDLGLARTAGLKADHHTPMGGSLGYLAPEQAVRAGIVDGRTDVFGLGATLFTMLTGHRAYRGEDLRSYLSAVAAGPAPDVRRRMPGISVATAMIVRKALACAPQDRFADAHGMLIALEEALTGLIRGPQGPLNRSGPRPPSPFVHRKTKTAVRSAVRRGVRRHLLVLISSMVLMLVGGILVGVRVFPTPRSVIPQATTSVAIPSVESASPVRPAQSQPPVVPQPVPAAPPVPPMKLPQAIPAAPPVPVPPAKPPILAVPAMPADPFPPGSAFTAWVDVVHGRNDPTERIATINPGQQDSLIDFDTGADTGITLQISPAPINAGRGSGAFPPSTPAAKLFPPSRIGLTGLINYSKVPVRLTFAHLDPARRYTLTLVGNRDPDAASLARSAYAMRHTVLLLHGAITADNTSTAGPTAGFEASLPFGSNTNTGHVAQWRHIAVGADGVLTVEIRPYAGKDASRSYLNGLRLDLEP